jgi:hypothetical protein
MRQRKLHYELHSPLSTVIWLIKVACMQVEKCIEFKGEEKGQLGRPNSRFRIILKWIPSK